MDRAPSKSSISVMGRRLSTDVSRFAYCAGDKPGDSGHRLQNPHDRPLTFADSGFRIGSGAAHQTGDQVRAISILANLLFPFAEERADQAARTLLSRFGTLERTLSASDELLAKALPADERTARLISAAKTLVLAGLHESITRTPVDTSCRTFQTYLVAKFKSKAKEELHAIFVDGEMGYLSEDLVSVGSSEKVDARISSILRRGLELGAAGFLLVHNHPSRSPNPSADDVRSTKQTMTLSKSVGIALIDHLIVAGNKVTSMKELQLI
jgi:DNA repair protein RadC